MRCVEQGVRSALATLLASLTLGSCSGTARETSPQNTKVFDSRVVVFVEAAAAEIEKARAESSEEDFAITADDLMFYRASAYEFVEQQGWPLVRLTGRRPLAFMVAGEPRIYRYDDVPWLDVIVLYDPGQEPHAIPAIDIATASEYFR